MKTTMENNKDSTKAALIQVWEDWDDTKPSQPSNEEPKLCKIENPDCEACQ